MMPKIISIVPARKGSKGLKNKNILPLFNKPLIAWSILFSINSRYIDKCIVTTDCERIADIARRYGASVPFLRDPTLSNDTASSSDVIIDVIERCNIKENDIILLLEPTSPYRKESDLDSIIKIIDQKSDVNVISVSEAVSTSYRFQFFRQKSDKGLISQLKGVDLPKDIRRQDIEKSYYIDGSFYLSNVSNFKKEKSFITNKTYSIISNYFSSFEIDIEEDLMLMNAIFKNLGPPF